MSAPLSHENTRAHFSEIIGWVEAAHAYAVEENSMFLSLHPQALREVINLLFLSLTSLNLCPQSCQ